MADASQIAPETYTLDTALLARPGNDEIQLDLFLDYASNVALYPKFQEYFRTKRPALLAVWGKNDPFFVPPGAEAFKRDNPNAEVKLFDTGHFALETHVTEIAREILDFLGRKLARTASVGWWAVPILMFSERPRTLGKSQCSVGALGGWMIFRYHGWSRRE